MTNDKPTYQDLENRISELENENQKLKNQISFSGNINLVQEKELFDYSQRLKLATISGQLGIWDWNVKDNVIIWDDRMFELYGINHDTFPNNIDAWTNGLHSEDKQRAIDECNAALNGEKDFNTTFRVIHPNGTILYLKADGLVLRDTDNKPLRMIGINKDVTIRKLAEEEIIKAKEKAEENEKKIRDLFDNMSDAFSLQEIILNENKEPYDYLYLEMNKACEEILGINALNTIGKTHLELNPINADITWKKVFYPVAFEGKSIKTEYFAPKFQKYLRITSFCPKKGQFANIFEDITERKEIEK